MTPNTFVQTQLADKDDDGNCTIMKIRGAVLDLICELDKECKKFVVTEWNQKVLYMHVTKAIYGSLVSAMLYYQKWVGNLKAMGFKVNPYDPCVANKMVNGKQMSFGGMPTSHKDPKVIDSFVE